MKFLRQILALLPKGRWKAKDIPGCLAVLPVLRAQIREVALQVEEAVVGVCGNFSGIAARARETVDKSAELLGGGQEEHCATVERSIESSRTTIAALLERLEHAGNLSSIVVDRMHEVEGAVKGVESLLAEVQKIAFTNKLVALNAKIEAVHVGELGSGFEVVADEITRQAERSNELADGIGQRVREMRDRVNRAASELRTFVMDDRASLSKSRNEAEAALDMLLSVHQRSRESLAMMASENTQLAREIADSVVGLQFQDRVGQCLGHVAEALEKVEYNLGGPATPLLMLATKEAGGAGSLREDVRQGYTMESERAVEARTLREPEPVSTGGDVELF